MFLVKQPPAQHQMADSVRDELVDILVHLAAKGTDGVEGHQTRAADQVSVELIFIRCKQTGLQMNELTLLCNGWRVTVC